MNVWKIINSLERLTRAQINRYEVMNMIGRFRIVQEYREK